MTATQWKNPGWKISGLKGSGWKGYAVNILGSLAVCCALMATASSAAPPRTFRQASLNGGPEVSDDGGIDGGDEAGIDCGASIQTDWPKWYVRGEYLFWQVQGDSTPALVTTSPTGTAQASAGVLGKSTTTILFGNEEINNDWQSGARLVVGYQFCEATRIEGEWFGLQQESTSFSATSDGSTILARPFFNLTTNAQDALLVAYPGKFSGTVSVQSSTNFMGGGIQAVVDLCDACAAEAPCDRIGMICGLRFLQLRDKLAIDDSRRSLDTSGPVTVGTVFDASDSFTTENNFYGANLGLSAEHRTGCWTMSIVGQVGLGATTEQVNVAGNSSTTTPTGTTTNFAGGLLALPTNIGVYHHDTFSIVPQVELKLAYDLTTNIRLTVGYDAIFWNHVARAGEQIDTSVNTTQGSGGTLVGLPGPLFGFKESSIWVQGVNAGAEIRF